MAKLAGLLAALGAFIAATATAGCITVYFDEPELPKSLM